MLPDGLKFPKGLEVYRLNDEGLPLKDFGDGIGWKYEPLCAIYFAQSWLDMFLHTGDQRYAEAVTHMIGIIDRTLSPVGDHPHARAIWNEAHYYPFHSKPWWCCMTTGRLVELYLRCQMHLLGGDFLSHAEMCIEALKLPHMRGGTWFGDKSNSIAYEELAELRPRHRCLNAHGSTLYSLYTWSEETGDEEVRELLRAGCNGFAKLLPHCETVSGTGSKIRLHGQGWLRLRTTSLNNEPSDVHVSEIILSFPEDGQIIMDIAAGHGLGWASESDNLGGLGELGRRDGAMGRAVPTRTVYSNAGDEVQVQYMLLRVGLTDWRSRPDERIEINVQAYGKAGDTLAVDLYPSTEKAYQTLLMETFPETGWQTFSGEIPMDDLGMLHEGVSGSHWYHHLNASYLEFVDWLRPDLDLTDRARRWMAASQYENVLNWHSEERIERRWQPKLSKQSTTI